MARSLAIWPRRRQSFVYLSINPLNCPVSSQAGLSGKLETALPFSGAENFDAKIEFGFPAVLVLIVL
jgi:hypothetical protein